MDYTIKISSKDLNGNLKELCSKLNTIDLIIRKGSSKAFVCDTNQGCHSAKSLVYYAK